MTATAPHARPMMASVIGYDTEHLDDDETIRRWAEASTPVRQIANDYTVVLSELGIPIDNPMLARIMDAAELRHARETKAAGARPEAPTRFRTSRQRHEPVVYYMRLGDLIKIGWSASITARKGSINPQGVVAVEFGPMTLERERHSQFVDLHQHGEWFRLDGSLADWIVDRRSAFETANGLSVERWLDDQRRAA